jgi:uncharacterized protein (DUF1501 family)
MAVVESVGASVADRSHFFTRNVWETADPKVSSRDGWLARLIQQRPVEEQLPPVCVGDEPLGLCVSSQVTPCVLRDLRDLEVAGALADSPAFHALNRQLGDAGGRSSPRRAWREALEAAERVAGYAVGGDAASASLADRLRTVATLIAEDYPSDVYATVLDGFDTHASQAYSHAQLLRELAEGMVSFFALLEQAGCADRVVVLCTSEFGRRVEENEGGGTDHGLAGPVLAFGNVVRGGFWGAPPDLADLEDGDLRVRVDFRRVFADVGEHLQLDGAAVLGREWAPVGFLRA